MVARLLIGCAIALSAGCLKKLPAFSCSEDSQCGAGGTCESNGLCSFSDATCASGRRFGAEQGDLSGTCVGEAPPADGGIDAPPDTQQCPNDLDCDNVTDDLDNCPTVANENQFNEDNDTPGDACDKCPPFDDNGEDSDGDGLGDQCDPHPGVADVLVEFAGFKEMPAGWNATGNWALEDGSIVGTAGGTAVNLMRATPPGDNYVVWTEVTVVDVAAPLLGAVGISVLHEAGTDQHGGLCQLVADDVVQQLRLFDTSAGNTQLDSVNHSVLEGSTYELFLERDQNDLACDASNPDVELAGTTMFVPTSSEVGLRVRNAIGRYRWVMVIRTP